MEISISSPSLRSSASTTTAGRRTAKLLPHLETCIKDIPSPLYIHTSLDATVRDSYHPRNLKCCQHLSRLCCKNNSGVETESTGNLVGRLLSFQPEHLANELNLPKDIPFRQRPHLAFLD